jgi:tetratricopeptide (TPR) repeat protein
VTRPLFEQYKDALRRGHLAARSGAIDDALAAYHEAAALAPDRAAPYASSATVLHRAGRRDEALAAFEHALAIAPDDEATLRGRAAAFEDMGRTASAAADLEHLAEALEAGGRRADALEAARRSVSLTATPARRRLVELLEAPESDEPVPRVMPPVVARPAPPPSTMVESGAAPVTPPTPPATAPSAEPPAAVEAAREASPAIEPPTRVPTSATHGYATQPRHPAPEAVPEEPEAPPEPEVPPEPIIPWPAIDLPSAPPPMWVGPPPDVEVLVAEANALIDGGDPAAARNLLLTAVAVHRSAGRSDAALDVCLQLLALAPGDAHVHLAIAGLQLDRGWRTLATEKIELLLRLTGLTGDTQAEADAHALAAERLRDEPAAGYARR